MKLSHKWLRKKVLVKNSTQKPMCYYVKNYVPINEDHSIFERLDMAMQQHMKPLYIRAKVNGVGIKKNWLTVEHVSMLFPSLS